MDATPDLATKRQTKRSEKLMQEHTPEAALAVKQSASVLEDLTEGSLRLLTCGSVDDGKSTLIGRMLWDASDLAEDTRASIEQTRGQSSSEAQPDFSRLLDGLVAEREQGITIDIAWRYFDADGRRYVIIDSPGHEQYTRNMATGASHADIAIMLTDARHGVKRQTRRHAAILHLMGVKRVVLAVNKMDLVDWSEKRFQDIECEFEKLSERFGFEQSVTIPVSALMGDNVARRSSIAPWYTGPSLLEHLQAQPTRTSNNTGAFRLPVQMVLRDGKDFRGLAGTVSSGVISRGDKIIDALSGRTANVARITTMDGDLESAGTGQAIALTLDTDIDVSRGAVIAKPGSEPSSTSRVSARLVWLSETPYEAHASYLLRTATDLIPINQLQVTALLDLETLASQPSDYACAMNDIAIAEIDLGRSAAIDTFQKTPATGNVMIVDAITGASVAGGIITETQSKKETSKDVDVVLTRAMLAAGLCRDLTDTPEDRVEFDRRAEEVTLLMKAAGLRVRREQ